VRAWARRALLLGLGLVLAACTLDVEVAVELEEDGSGVVEVTATLDAEAVARVGGDLAAALALDDLRADGWRVEGPTRAADGTTTVRLRQPFAGPEAADQVFEELAGAGGPFRDLEVRLTRSLLETTWGFSGTVDLGGATSLPDLAAPPVDGEAPAATYEQLEEQLGESLERLLRLRVGVRLPGDVDSNATTRADNGAIWRIGFGDGPVELDATGREARTGMVALLVAGGLAVVVGGVALLVRLAMRTTAAAEDRG
jgi:hypothetical protein